MNYEGMKCPVCGKPFSADDDIVVCPQCGAPYHRECYAKTGECVFADRHGTPYAWKPPQPAEQSGGEMKHCPRCGAPNTAEALFCIHCGQPLSGEENPRGNPFPGQGYGPDGAQPGPNSWPGDSNGAPRQDGNFPPQNGQNSNIPPEYGFPFVYDPLGGVNPNEPIDGVPAGDVAKFVQGNTPYYLPVFMDLSRFKRNRFNFSAFLFQGIWMLYRKMYKIGALFAALQGALLFCYLVFMKYVGTPFYEKLYTAAGITNSNYYSMTADQQDAFRKLFYGLPTLQKFIAFSPVLFLLAQIAIMLISGFLANKLYLKFCVTKVGKIGTETSSQTEYFIRLQQEGGMNIAIASLLFLCFFLIFSYSSL